MRRREFITLLGGTLSAWPLRARAQLSNAPRVGYVFPFTTAESQGLWQACRQGLRDFGYSEGQNVILEPRWAEGRYERLPSLVDDLLRLKADVIVAVATPAARAAKAATNTTPIVFVAVADPLAAGLVATLARPGGNVTGLSLLTSELSGKRLTLLVEIVGKVSRAAILMNPDNPISAIVLAETQLAARQLGIELQPSEARRPEDIKQAFAVGWGPHVDALIVIDDPALWSYRAQIVALAAAKKIPAMYGFKDFVDDGGLISYGPDRPGQYRRTAMYVDKILKGAVPADLPVEQPTKFELFINRKTATSLGLTIPQTLLATADEVIE